MELTYVKVIKLGDRVRINLHGNRLVKKHFRNCVCTVEAIGPCGRIKLKPVDGDLVLSHGKLNMVFYSHEIDKLEERLYD